MSREQPGALTRSTEMRRFAREHDLIVLSVADVVAAAAAANPPGTPRRRDGSCS
ncbi:hypothetical protein [Pseudonocardia sp. GCM10023141]|uniref:hypothetical protein n=1 Tax=Pseudonocardia sp. GCM10023141 TaxID=3252653 RepID=UPI003619FB7A